MRPRSSMRPSRCLPEDRTAHARLGPHGILRPWASTASTPETTRILMGSPATTALRLTSAARIAVPAGRPRTATASAGGTKGVRPDRTSCSTMVKEEASASPARTTRVVTAVSAQTSRCTHPQPEQSRPENLTATRPEPSMACVTLAFQMRQLADADQEIGTMRAPGIASARVSDSLTALGRTFWIEGASPETAWRASRMATIVTSCLVKLG